MRRENYATKKGFLILLGLTLFSFIGKIWRPFLPFPRSFLFQQADVALLRGHVRGERRGDGMESAIWRG